MTEAEEQAYIRGGNAVASKFLREALRELGGEEQDAHAWRLERAATVEALRGVCEVHGDNDWPDDLHLADVIDKHLGRYLGELANEL